MTLNKEGRIPWQTMPAKKMEVHYIADDTRIGINHGHTHCMVCMSLQHIPALHRTAYTVTYLPSRDATDHYKDTQYAAQSIVMVRILG